MPKNIFPYKGSKRRFADWIVGHLPPHKCYVEPFGGSGAVLWNKPESTIEVYNDINSDLVDFFRTLRSSTDELMETLRWTPYSRELFEQWEDEWANGERPDDDVERAAQFFYLRYTKFGGDVRARSGFMTGSSWDCPGSYSNKIEALDEFADRFRGIVIENIDWRKMFDKYDSENTLFYLDPPYVDSEHRYAYEFDHEDFVNSLNDVAGMWILSYSELPEGLDRYHTVEQTAIHGVADSTKETTERLVMNFDPDETPRFESANQSTLTAHAER